MTKIEMLTSIRETVATNPEMVEFLNHEIELLQRKAATPRKPTATQEANEKYKALILEFLTVQPEGRTCTEVAKSVPELNDFNNQKIAALMRQLVEAGRVNKATVKGKSVFTLA